jgi:hypothetical protein
MAGGDFVVFSHSFSTILIGQLARLAAAKLPGASPTILVRSQTKIAESLPLLVRFLLTKIEQDLLSTQPLGQETPLDPVEAAAAVSCVVMLRLFCELSESPPLLVRFLLTKIEQDLLSTQPLGQETPCWIEKSSGGGELHDAAVVFVQAD